MSDLNKSRLRVFLVALATAIVIFLASHKEADASDPDFDFLKLNEAHFQYLKFADGSRDPLITENGLRNRAMNTELNLFVKLDVLKYFYFDNQIHSLTDQGIDGSNGQFRAVGWEYRAGVRLNSYFDVGYYHFSQHAIDHTLPYHWPVKDAIEINIYFFRQSGLRESIF
jgi:hypothetical protein